MCSQPTNDQRPLSVISEHIVVTPDTCGGKPRIAGHRITVQNIVVWHEQCGLSPDEIVGQHPGITLADVHAALAYYWDHSAEIRAQMQSDEQFVEELQSKSPSLLEAKVRQRNANNDSIPS